MVTAYPCNPSHPLALTRCKPSYIDQPCGSAKHSRTMTNDCDRSHAVMSRHNYMRKRNWQLSWFSRRPPKSPRTSGTATKRSSGNADSHICSDSSGDKQKMFMPTSAKKCDAKVSPTNSTTPRLPNHNVTSWIHLYHFGGKIKHADETCQANKSTLLKTGKQDLNMTGVTGKQTCQAINKARKQNL